MDLTDSLAVTGRSIADAYAAACGADCTTAISSFLRQVRTGTGGTVYYLAMGLGYVVPALIGIFWGAPLLAREFETGTHRLAWNQSVTRTFATNSPSSARRRRQPPACSVGASPPGHTVSTRQPATGSGLGVRRSRIVPIGYALFAFALGVTAGLLIRRTVPAMAATLAVYTAAIGSMPLWIRAHLVPASHATPALDLNKLQMFGFAPDGRMEVLGDGPSNAWVLSNQTITPTGDVFTGPANPQYCGANKPLHACEEWAATLGLRQDITYHPADHFWPLQWVESGLFLAAAALLTGFCFWWIRRRRA